MVKKYLIFLWLLVFTGGLGNIVSCGGNGSGSGSGSDIGDLRISTQNLYLGLDLTPVAGALALQAGLSDTSSTISTAVVAAITAAATASSPEVDFTGLPFPISLIGTVPIATASDSDLFARYVAMTLAAILPTAVGILLSNDFNARAEALARIILRERPHVIGLQEVSSYSGGPISQAVPDGIDFLKILTDELEKVNLSYEVAVTGRGASITVPIPAVGTGEASNVSYTNRDILLVESGITVSDPSSEVYEDNLQVGGAEFTRTYVRATLQREGASPFVVVNTHLEANPANPAIGALQALQLGQLQTVLTAIEGPVFLIGDLNSFAPDTGVVETGATSTSYEALIDAGFTDSYLEANPATETTANSTCCYNEVLDITVDITTYGRVDHILYRGEEITPSQVRFTGNEATDQARVRRTGGDTKIWPSDHLGVVGTFPGDL